ncbi:UNVERIFIED_CONTAM: putative mitochondrial protein [Sesamum calycinum]|uniref:Mitochondrial protein n=1 Tax=Sesamum calycinum TaxID=2727403 RepID=A0AAW2JKW8_9LAMI
MSNDLSLVLEFERGGLMVNSALATNLFYIPFLIRKGKDVPSRWISFVAGQPLGYRSSWPLSAFTHHVLVWWCAEQVYPGRLFTGYALLGDDILITDKKAEYAQEDEAEAEGSKPRKAPVIHSIQWQPPPPGWMKVNTDGCSRGQPGPSSCGGIFRNCRGLYMDALRFRWAADSHIRQSGFGL